ncbi:WXG100 family type VII secretion target [Mangrovihabitans endophyticus]|uniref:WXG100 family type VII secretion target n=1 Tax=Mangrovihabitans endophyticus TaxID=1751298 RepID=UPI0016698E0A|nr:hypothetical protein [Mangrovihabitans endophyticus]
MPERPEIWTDFSRYPHAELIRALSASNPNAVTAAGDVWADVAAALHERADDVADRTTELRRTWSGVAADRFQVMAGDLLTGIRRVADAAQEMRDLAYAAGEALYAAWTAMPAVSGEAARRQAILVMAELAERYLVLAAQFHEAMSQLLPGAADPATAGAPGRDGVPAGTLPPAKLVFGSPSGPGGSSAGRGGPDPLFGRMLPAGLATAAVLGRRFVPSLLTPRRQADGYSPAHPPADPQTPVPPDATVGPADPDIDDPDIDDQQIGDQQIGDLAGSGPPPGGLPGPDADAAELDELSAGGGLDPLPGGGGSLGGADLGSLSGGGLGPLPDAPDIGGTATAGGVTAAAGVGAAAGAGAGAASARPMMPMMPMMPMGMGGEGGGGRRLPPWLVETEDVWGESAAMTAPVIGEDADAGGW